MTNFQSPLLKVFIAFMHNTLTYNLRQTNNKKNATIILNKASPAYEPLPPESLTPLSHALILTVLNKTLTF